jgi:hypothetical protein
MARPEFPSVSCLRPPRPSRRSSHDGVAVFVLATGSAPQLQTRVAQLLPSRSRRRPLHRRYGPDRGPSSHGSGSVSGGRIGVPGLAPTCRCERGAIPYLEDGSASCAKCGRALEPATLDMQNSASIGVEERTGRTPPGPSPEPAARPNGRDRARPPDAEPPPAPTLAPQACSGPSFEWPFGPGAGKGPPGQRAGSAR